MYNGSLRGRGRDFDRGGPSEKGRKRSDLLDQIFLKP
jgi:hypothetical protein